MIERINEWMKNVIAVGSWERYNDIHIDKINPAYKGKDSWIVGGVECYNLAIESIKQLNLPFVVELSIPLKSKRKDGYYKVKSMSEFNKELDYTPPSLFIFHEAWNGLEVIKSKGEQLTDFIANDKGTFFYSQAYSELDKEVRRVIFLI